MTNAGTGPTEAGPAPLFLWAACVIGHDLLSRCEAVRTGEFIGMSVLCAPGSLACTRMSMGPKSPLTASVTINAPSAG